MKSDNSITTLDRIKAESYCVIKTVSLRDDIKARFSEMGLVPETLVYVKKRAPLRPHGNLRQRLLAVHKKHRRGAYKR